MILIFQQLPKIIFAIVSALIAYQAALLTWSIYPVQGDFYVWDASTKSKISNTKINTLALQKQFLFGQYKGVHTSPIKQNSNNAPKTRLKISLVGIIAASDSALSSVIIEYRGKQDSYFIDSEITGTNAVVVEIYDDHIIILVDGEQQTLILDGLEEDNRIIESIATTKNISSGRSRRKSAKKSKEIILDRNELLENPSKLQDFIRISPVREGNKVKGYRVKPGKYPSLFESSGLQAGDLAVELNGIDLTDMSKAIGLMKEFPTMKEISLTVDRNGELNELFFSIP